MVNEENHGFLLQRFRNGFNVGVLAELEEQRVGGVGKLSLGRAHFKLRVKVGVEAADEFAESVEDGQRADQGHRGQRHSCGRNAGNDVDGVVALLGEKITAGDEKGKVDQGDMR